MTRWLITGAGGMVGRELTAVLADRAGAQVAALTRAELDITDPAACRAAIVGSGAEVVVNAAGWRNADTAESAEAAAMVVNGDGPRHLAVACRAAGARLIHISTDYVFDGDARAPYPEDALVTPRNAYGRSKAAGERAVLSELATEGYVIRTAWLYGEHGPNFVRTMIRLERERETIAVVDDQRGQPTWARELALRLVALGDARGVPAGIYHVSGAGSATWYELAWTVFAELGADPRRVHPTTTDEFPRPARRPAYSVLGHERWTVTGLEALPDWQVSLKAALPRLVAVETGRLDHWPGGRREDA